MHVVCARGLSAALGCSANGGIEDLEHITLRLAVAALAFTIGVGAAALRLPVSTRRPRSKTHVAQAPQAPPEPAEPFTPDGGAYARLDDGWVDTDLYRAADGSRLSYSREGHRSPTQAARGMRSEIRKSELVVERKPVTDESGRRIGERAVVLWRANTRSWAKASVLWTRESISFSINAESLERALEFERYYQERR